jgi:hypothetical protein
MIFFGKPVPTFPDHALGAAAGVLVLCGGVWYSSGQRPVRARVATNA